MDWALVTVLSIIAGSNCLIFSHVAKRENNHGLTSTLAIAATACFVLALVSAGISILS